MPRTPPHDLDAERAIIGVALLDTLRATATELTADQFYTPAHQHIWHAILTHDGQADPITLAAALHQAGHQGQPYEAATLTRHTLDVPSVSNAARYATTIATHAEARRLIHIAATITEHAYNGQIDAATSAAADIERHQPAGDQLDTVQWADIWNDDNDAEDWLIYPIVPRGRAVALYAAAKTGKSTILLAALAAAVTNRSVFGMGKTDPCHILYLDYEMTRADLIERLSLLGYGPTDNLDHLHYALLPNLPPLDTAAGARALVKHAHQCGAQLVVVDTFGRAVQGEENESDTVRNFYRHTGQALKAAGIAVLRADHAGKDTTKGQRGTSAKNDDVDIVWELRRTDTGTIMRRTHSRITWCPEQLVIDQISNQDGTLTYRERGGEGYPEGTRELMIELDRLGLEPSASARKAASALRDAGIQASNALIRATQRARRNDTRLAGHHFPATTQSDDKPTFQARRVSGAVTGTPDPGAVDGAARRAFSDPSQDHENTGKDRAAKTAARRGAVDGTSSGAPPLYIERRAGRAPTEVTESNNEEHTEEPEWPF